MTRVSDPFASLQRRNQPAEENPYMSNVPVKSGATLVALLVDRSGSMATCHAGMEKGLNDFVRDQAREPGDGAVMLAQFDDQYEISWRMQPLASAPHYSLQPRGRTALCDAIGTYISDVNDVLSNDEAYRPVIMCIVTDGDTNADKEWDLPTVRQWVQHQRDVYHWEFVFLGANIDAVKMAAKYGIPKDAALTFSTSKARESYATLSRYVSDSRRGRAAQFTLEDRRKAIGQ